MATSRNARRMSAKLRLEAKAFRIRKAALAARETAERTARALLPLDPSAAIHVLPGGPQGFRSSLAGMKGKTHSLSAGGKDVQRKRDMPEGWQETTAIAKARSGRD